MGLQYLLMMLFLIFSTLWETRVTTGGESDTNRTYHCTELSYKENIMEAGHIVPSLLIHDEHHKPLLNTTVEYGNIVCALRSTLRGSASTQNCVDFVSRKKVIQENSLKVQKLQNIREDSLLSTEQVSSLGQMLVTVVKAELRDCALVVAYDTGYSGHPVLQHLLLLHNPRQVVYVNTTEDLTRIIWTSSMCRGYFLLLNDPEPLLTFATTYQDTWDYSGRFLLVVPSLRYLEAFIDTYIGERTEHIVGAVKVMFSYSF
ncbi:uncharacterized protein [Panulirus ornatus]|uniref:uncharacterized protein n=1 Tax=Panulirus ornatus TaxID=150431 RepID=UPI003A89A06A